MRTFVVVVILLFGFLPILGFAETTLTLSQAFELAKKNNLEFQTAQKEVQSLEGDLIQAGLIPNPTLDLEQKSTPLLGFQEGEKGLFLSQELELGGKRSARLSVARTALDQAQFNLSNKARDLRQRVRITFYETWVAEQRLKILEEILGSQQQFLSLNEARVKLGAIPGLEVKLIKAEYLRVQQKLEMAQKETQTTLANLLQILSLPAHEKPILASSTDSNAPLSKPDVLLSKAFENRSDLKGQEKALEKAEAQIRLEKAQSFSNLTVGVGTAWDKLLIQSDGITPAGIISQINQQDQLYQIRFSLPLPIFNRNQGNILKAERLRESELLKTQNLKRTIQTEVMTAWEKVKANRKIHERFENEFLPAVKENLDIVEKAYRLGGESVLAVIQAQRTLSETQLDYLDNLRELQESIAALESAIGMELP